MVRDGKLQVPDARALARAMTLMNNAYLLAEFGASLRGIATSPWPRSRRSGCASRRRYRNLDKEARS